MGEKTKVFDGKKEACGIFHHNYCTGHLTFSHYEILHGKMYIQLWDKDLIYSDVISRYSAVIPKILD